MAHPHPERARDPAGRYLAALAVLVYAIAICKAVRLPNSWAATHMTFNYSEGFVRRGLVGQLIKTLGGERFFRYQWLAGLAFVLFAAVGVMLVVFIRRTLAVSARDREYWVCIIALGASPGIVVLIHAIGYLDYVGLLALLSMLSIARPAPGRYLLFPAVALLGTGLAFIHEMLVVMFVPTMSFALLCLVISRLRGRGASRATWARWIAGLALATMIPFLAAAIVGTLGTKSAALVHAMQAKIAPHTDFPLRTDAFEVLYKPFRENVLKQMPFHWTFAENRAYLVAGLKSIAPVLGFFLFYGVAVLSRVRASLPARAALIAVFVGATVAPLLLHFAGWDNSRWNAASVLVCFVCLGTMRLFFGAEVASPRQESSLILTLGAAAIVLGLCTSYNNFLFDGYTVRWFPFAEPFRWR